MLTKDDYEQYQVTRGQYVTALSGDLVAKMFLFLGFSFTDPNLDYILSRVRISLHGRPRDHYCVFKRCSRPDYQTDDAYRYGVIKQQLAINDLKRFGVQAILVDEYSEVTSLLRQVENRYKRRTVLISGSAHEYGAWTREESEALIRSLAQLLIRKDFRIVSGFGLGVGSHVISGVLEEIYQNEGRRLHDQLILRPFPQGEGAQQQWEAYRQEMIAHAGVGIFVFGNKLQSDRVVPANGLRREFEIAKERGLMLIPIGATGYVARELWQEIMGDFATFYPSHPELRSLFESLGNETEIQKIIESVTTIIGRAKGL